MKFRFAIIAALATLTFLSACNFTLAEDITPPPNYVPPTPAPTLGPLYPAQAPRSVLPATVKPVWAGAGGGARLPLLYRGLPCVRSRPGRRLPSGTPLSRA